MKAGNFFFLIVHCFLLSASNSVWNTLDAHYIFATLVAK